MCTGGTAAGGACDARGHLGTNPCVGPSKDSSSKHAGRAKVGNRAVLQHASVLQGTPGLGPAAARSWAARRAAVQKATLAVTNSIVHRRNAMSARAQPPRAADAPPGGPWMVVGYPMGR